MKECILQYAAVLFATHGFAGTSMRTLAQQVGITPSSLYHHFPNKEALYEAVMKHVIGQVQPIYDQVCTLPPEKALPRLIQQLAVFMEAEPHVSRLFQWLFLQPVNRARPIMQSWYPHYRQVVEMLIQLVRDEQKARALALQLFSMLLMCYASKEAMATLPGQQSLCDSPDRVAEYVWSALRAQIKESAHV